MNIKKHSLLFRSRAALINSYNINKNNNLLFFTKKAMKVNKYR